MEVREFLGCRFQWQRSAVGIFTQDDEKTAGLSKTARRDFVERDRKTLERP
jgi:hypothetical protein